MVDADGPVKEMGILPTNQVQRIAHDLGVDESKVRKAMKDLGYSIPLNSQQYSQVKEHIKVKQEDRVRIDRLMKEQVERLAAQVKEIDGSGKEEDEPEFD